MKFIAQTNIKTGERAGVEAGEPIELGEKEAQPLLACGALRPADGEANAEAKSARTDGGKTADNKTAGGSTVGK